MISDPKIADLPDFRHNTDFLKKSQTVILTIFNRLNFNRFRKKFKNIDFVL